MGASLVDILLQAANLPIIHSFFTDNGSVDILLGFLIDEVYRLIADWGTILSRHWSANEASLWTFFYFSFITSFSCPLLRCCD